MKKYDTSERPDLDALERKAEQHIKSCSSRWSSAKDKWLIRLRLIDYIRHLESELEDARNNPSAKLSESETHRK